MMIDSRGISSRMPRPLWIGLASVVLIVIAVGLRIGIPVYRQQVAFQEIERVGGIIYDARPPGPEWLPDFLRGPGTERFDDVIFVAFDGTPANDDTLRKMSGLTRLEELCLFHTLITDAGLQHLQELNMLRTLNLGLTNVTDAGLAHLAKLPGLRQVTLNNTHVTDAGVAELQRALPGLKVDR